MTVLRIPAGAVLLTGSALEAARYAVTVAQRARRRNGLPPLGSLVALAEALDAAASVGGHEDTTDDTPGEADYMTTDEAARLLGCTPRTARRKASALGGRIIGGRWLVDRQAVAEHLEGMTA